MCGIFGYIGNENGVPFLLKGLEQLEYRGYDSAGLAIINNEGMHLHKIKGRVSLLVNKTKHLEASIGIAHTRWATHGVPSARNAHPHLDEEQKIAIVHNGIIENHTLLKQQHNITCTSDTDSEVLAHLISKEMRKVSFPEAVRQALEKVEGAYGLVILHKDYPDQLIAARKGSPLVIGITKNARFIASDPSALLEHTRNVIYLEDNELAVLTKNSHEIQSLQTGKIHDSKITAIDWNIEQLGKEGFDHFMLKEIYEQPRAILNTIRGRMNMLLERGSLPALDSTKLKPKNINRIIIIACGTSWHAGLVAKQYFEQLTKIVTEVAYASELRYNTPLLSKKDLVIVISQSGETADTLEALRLCKEKGVCTLGVVNVVGSTIAREVDAGLYLHAGPEIGVASTKAFTTQLIALLIMAIHLGLARKTITKKEVQELYESFTALLPAIEEAVELHQDIKKIANNFITSENALYLGRGLHFPVALEGALKLKEISYIHAEGLPAAEMKHGPIALIDEHMPVIVLAPHDHLYTKILSNIQEVKARGGKVIVITSKHDPHLTLLADYVIQVNSIHPLLQPLVSVIPLQLLAYELATLRGCDVDKPRNLAKAVSVE